MSDVLELEDTEVLIGNHISDVSRKAVALAV